MKRFGWLITMLMVVGLVLPVTSGCTAPTQPIAQKAFERGEVHGFDVYENLEDLAKTINFTSMKQPLEAAVEAKDQQAAKDLVKERFDNLEKILYLRIQYERSMHLKRFSYAYIVEQKGILNILEEEWKEAEQRAKTAEAIKQILQGENRNPSGVFGLKNLDLEKLKSSSSK